MESIKYKIQELLAEELTLTKYFYENASVTNYEKGYISAPWINQLIDTRLQRLAARNLAFKIMRQNQGITKVLGIPTLGVPLASLVADEFGVQQGLARKGNHIPGAWKDTIVIDEEVASFTTGAKNQFVVNGLVGGDVVMFVDDFLAYGDTSVAFVEAMRNHNITPYIGVYCAKLFQPGIQRLKDIGINPEFVYGIESIIIDGGLSLARSSLI